MDASRLPELKNRYPAIGSGVGVIAYAAVIHQPNRATADLLELITEVERLQRELTRIRDGDLSYAAMKTVALEALEPTTGRVDLDTPIQPYVAEAHKLADLAVWHIERTDTNDVHMVTAVHAVTEAVRQLSKAVDGLITASAREG